MIDAEQVNLRIAPGEIVVVNVEEGRENLPIPDGAEGLLAPESGRVLFQGVEWPDLSPRRQALLRSTIGRVFEHFGWISNLDIMENVCLAEWHHTRRPAAAIAEEADRWARRFGVFPIPDRRPAWLHPMTLRKLEWVRAFMGQRRLLILEQPLRGTARDDAPLLFEAVCEAARQGVAVLWTSARPLTNLGATCVRLLAMQGSFLTSP